MLHIYLFHMHTSQVVFNQDHSPDDDDDDDVEWLAEGATKHLDTKPLKETVNQ